MVRKKDTDENVVYCICPKCGMVRKKENRKYTIIRRGKERNGFARFFCLGCKTWFNERKGNAMHWYER